MAQWRTCRFLHQRWNKSTRLWKFNYFSNSRLRSHKSHAIFHWINFITERLLGWTLYQLVHLFIRMVWAEGFWVSFNGWTLFMEVSRLSIFICFMNLHPVSCFQSQGCLLCYNKCETTIRSRLLRVRIKSFNSAVIIKSFLNLHRKNRRFARMHGRNMEDSEYTGVRRK